MAPSVLDQLQQYRSGEARQETPAPSSALPVVGSYARISDAYESRETGVTEGGVKRQLQANKHIVQARQWQLAERLYVDNNVSAFKSNVVRDAFEDLLDDLEAGVIDGIVCYNLDRFARQVSDLERAIRIYDEARKQGRELVFATAEGDLNLASDDGLTMARVMVAFANKASRDTARRVSLKHQEMRDEGRAIGGARPFGWDWQRDRATGIDGTVIEGPRYHVLNVREAAAIREAATGLTDGSMTWRDVVRAWNEAGLLTPRGGAWQPQTVKQVMRNPRLAGWLVHKGKIAVHSRTGRLIRANAPAILTDEEFEALLVATDGRRGTTQASGRRRYLLAGVVRCAECGARMAGSKAGRYYYYNCRLGNGVARDGGNPCGHVSISGLGLDALITELVLPRVIEETAGLTASTERPHQEELLALQTEKEGLLTAYRDHKATSEIVFPEVTRIEARIEELRYLQAEWSREQKVLARGISVTEETWNSLDVEEQRTHIARHIEAVYVKAATRRGNRFDHERVLPPVWRKRVSPVELPVAVGQ